MSNYDYPTTAEATKFCEEFRENCKKKWNDKITKYEAIYFKSKDIEGIKPLLKFLRKKIAYLKYKRDSYGAYEK